MEKNSDRLYLLDALRGFVVLMMIAFHFCYDYFVIFGGNYEWPLKRSIFIWEQSICCSFNLISGFVWRFGKKNCIRRGVIVNLCGFAVTFATLLIMPEMPILYGVLTFLGCAMILMLPLSKLLDRLPALPGVLISLALFLATFCIPRGGLGFYDHLLFPLPQALYHSALLTPLGFPYIGFYSSDYFPLIPWIFLYICGYFLNRLLLAKESVTRFLTYRIPPLEWIGRHSLLLYMLHQPVCYGVCLLLFHA
ncbi:MAG: DUF1624 domain-containing protein [Lachnospiraceae bacterium]|nr:DUF1624 domain-containing protein [Lachnospiraceae bacterium]